MKETVETNILTTVETLKKKKFNSFQSVAIIALSFLVLFYPILFSYLSIRNENNFVSSNTFVFYFFLVLMIVSSIFNYLILLVVGKTRVIFVPILSVLSFFLIFQTIEASSQINTPNFKFWHQDIDFYFNSSTNLIIILFIISLLLMIFVGKNISKNRIISNSTILHIALTNFFFVILLNLNWLRELLLKKLTEVTKETDSFLSSQFLIALIVYILSYLLVKSWNDLLNNTSTITLSLVTSFILAVVCNFFLQQGIRKEELLLGQYIFPGALLFQILTLTVIFFIVYLLLNRYMLSTLILSFLVYTLSIANALKFELRNEPLLLSDLTWLSDLQLIFSFIDDKFFKQFITFSALSICVYWLFLRKIHHRQIVRKLSYRLLLLLIPLSITVSVFNVFEAEKDRKIQEGIPLISNLNNRYDIGWLSFAENARYKSIAYVWMKQLTKPLIEEPRSYSKSLISDLVEKYSLEADTINEGRTENIDDQTIIFVLSESFADPTRLDNVEVSEDIIPNIRNIIAHNTGGLMISDGYGGGTANMEFQALTGLAYRSFSDSVSIAYTEIVPKLSYLPSISNAFSDENRFVIHPANSTNYNRKNIYSKLHFDRFIAHINSDVPMKDVEVVGANISDKTAYSNVLNLLDEERNQFFSLITMQNHIPYVLDNPEHIIASGTNFTQEENTTLTSYARLLSVTDSETVQFLEKLSTFGKKITVVFYGDHLPGIYPESVFQDEPNKQYLTDFFIWSNYQTQKTKFDTIYSSDFIAVLLEHTNAKVTPYQALLTRVAEESSNSVINGEAMNDLKLLEYDLTEGKNYLQRFIEFFE